MRDYTLQSLLIVVVATILIGLLFSKPWRSLARADLIARQRSERRGAHNAIVYLRSDRRRVLKAHRKEYRAIRFVNQHFMLGVEGAEYLGDKVTRLRIPVLPADLSYDHPTRSVRFVPECEQCKVSEIKYSFSNQLGLDKAIVLYRTGNWHAEECPSRREGIKEVTAEATGSE